MKPNLIAENRSEFRQRLRELAGDVEPRVSADITRYRMAEAVIRVVDANNQPVKGAMIEVEQTAADFLFGSQAFLVDQFETTEENQRYEKLFSDVFNQAIVPFYWDALEPEQGKPRYDVDSPKIYRRPPIDTVLNFCERHGIVPKAHVLAYHSYGPKWMPTDPVECERLYEAHFAEIGQRYRHRIPMWDVVNEPLNRYIWIYQNRDQFPMPNDWVRWSFNRARHHFPGCQLILNEDTKVWEDMGHPYSFSFELHPFYLLVQNLLLQGVPVDALGLQSYVIGEMDYHGPGGGRNGKKNTEADLWEKTGTHVDGPRSLQPARVLMVLDQYAKLGLPIHISELSAPCYGVTDDDENLQAEIIEMLYRTWFSHPAVQSMTYWSVVDGYGYDGINPNFFEGILRNDLSEKPVYNTLKRLIRETWRTNFSTVCPEGRHAFRGFHGQFRVKAHLNSRMAQSEFHIGPNCVADVLLRLP